jgi:hypothetical protein
MVAADAGPGAGASGSADAEVFGFAAGVAECGTYDDGKMIGSGVGVGAGAAAVAADGGAGSRSFSRVKLAARIAT